MLGEKKAHFSLAVSVSLHAGVYFCVVFLAFHQSSHFIKCVPSESKHHKQSRWTKCDIFMRNPSLKARDASDGDQSVLNTMIHSQRLGDVFFSSFAVHLFHFRLELADGTFSDRIWIRTLSLCLSNTGTRSFTWKLTEKGGGGLLIDKTQSAAFTVYFLPRDKGFFLPNTGVEPTQK